MPDQVVDRVEATVVGANTRAYTAVSTYRRPYGVEDEHACAHPARWLA